MSINTTIAGLSQNQALNGPDGTVDLPSSMDDAQRYALSFIAMLRDGAGFSTGALTTALGFTPVRQGGFSTGTTTNTVSLGYNTTSGKLVMAVDSNQFGNKWPIDTTGDAATVGGQSFPYVNAGNNPTYLWGSDASNNNYLASRAALSVNFANSAGSATNATVLNGISGWSYSAVGGTPTYVWSTNGSSASQFLTSPGNFSVANAANANGCSGNAATCTTATTLQGLVPSNFVQAGGSVISMTNSGLSQMTANVGGTSVFWGISVSDARLKENVRPVEVDSLERIAAIDFVGYNFRTIKGDIQIDDGRRHPVGLLAQQAATIAPEWIEEVPGGIEGHHLAPNHYALLMDTMHAMQQLRARVLALEGAK